MLQNIINTKYLYIKEYFQIYNTVHSCTL